MTGTEPIDGNNDIYNSKSKNTYAFLCGQLDIKDTSQFVNAIDTNNDKWERCNLEEDKYLKNCNIYYKGYVDSIYPNDAISGSFYSTLAEYKYILPENNLCSINIIQNNKLKKIEFNVSEITLCCFPHNVVLYYIKIVENDLLLNDVTMLHFHLRDVLTYNDKCKNEDIEQYVYFENYLEAIAPLTNLCTIDNKNKQDVVNLVKNGNKLKLFQIVEASEYYNKIEHQMAISPQVVDRDQQTDELLFELATLSVVGVIDDIDNKFSPSKSYFNELVKDNIIQPFKNWKALAIFDTFTIICDSFDKKRFNAEDWERYFRLIYIHVLYQKTVLFELNQDFHVAIIGKNGLTKLVDKMKDHECYYGFPNISYNFQPQMIYEQILKGLNVDTERVQLRYYLEQENERQEIIRVQRELDNEKIEQANERNAKKEKEIEKEQQERINKLFGVILGFITVLSIASALNDATSLFITLNKDPNMCYIKLFFAGATITVIVGILVIIIKYGKGVLWKSKIK